MTTAYDALPSELLEELQRAGLDPRAVYDDIAGALEEDLPGGAEDVTSAATIPADQKGSAVLAAREAGVVAGLGIAALVFHCVLGDDVEVTERMPDGTTVAVGGPPEVPVLAHGQQVAQARGLVAADPKRGAQVVKSWVSADE